MDNQDKDKRDSLTFRRQALEYIATPPALDDLLEIAAPLAWVFALALWLVVISLILWLFLGSIMTHVRGNGILLTEKTAVVYVSALTAQRLQPGMKVHIHPGTAVGLVTAVGSAPDTPENMQAVLKNSSLVSYFLRSGPVVALWIQSATPLTPGALIEARITVRRQSPWSLMLSR
jgi:hypothetical protein